jgi:flagellar protein FlbD
MIKLTRLNNHPILVNPDHVQLAEAMPDTTLRLIDGDTLLVRESLEELVDRVVEYRRRVRDGEPTDASRDAKAVAVLTNRHHDDDAEEEG